MTQCVVYWLFDDTCVCPWRHGYVGITTRWPGRLKRHRQRFGSGIRWQLLFSGAKTECRLLEYQLRPDLNIGWNVNPGGMMSPRLGGVVPSDVREKMRQSAKRRHQQHPMSEQTRERLRIASTGRTNRGRIGQKKTLEERERISRSKQGIPKSEQHRLKMSQRMQGKTLHAGHHHSEQTKQRLRLQKFGIAVHSEEHRRRLAERMKGNSFTKGKPWSAARRMAWLARKEN